MRWNHSALISIFDDEEYLPPYTRKRTFIYENRNTHVRVAPAGQNACVRAFHWCNKGLRVVNRLYRDAERFDSSHFYFQGKKMTTRATDFGRPFQKLVAAGNCPQFAGMKWYGGQGPVIVTWQSLKCRVAVP